MWETRWGYKDNWECLRDPRGIYAAFRKLKSLRLNGLQFDDCFSSAVRIHPKGVRGACYHGDGRQILLLANSSGSRQRNIRWSYDGRVGSIPSLDADEYRFIELG